MLAVSIPMQRRSLHVGTKLHRVDSAESTWFSGVRRTLSVSSLAIL